MKYLVFEKYKNLLQERINKISFLEIREDSIRYDFFVALSEKEKLNPSDIQLEYSIHKSAYLPRDNKQSKRNENPQIDLVVNISTNKLNFEFGLFRKNSNENGGIDKTAKTVKMINDMIRLALDSKFTSRESYFICVADEKILGHQLQSKIIGAFPSNYLINKDLIFNLKQLKTSRLDDRFLNKLCELDLNINCNIIFNEKLEAISLDLETRVIVWKVTLL
jgi:hypothetical protein